MFEFIGVTLAIVFLAVGVLGLVSAKFRTMLRGIPVVSKFLKPEIMSVLFITVGVLAGGIAGVSSYLNVGSLTGADDVLVGTAGALDLTIHDGLSNATTTEDYYNDDDTFLTFYSADASILDGEEYLWNITIERSLVAEDVSIKVSCSVPDKEISGVTADNIAEKTSGQIDLDINDGGKHSDDNTVYKYFAMAEGTGSLEVQVAFDQEETYHDGMVDLDDYVDAVCVITADDGTSASVSTRIYADS